MRGTYSIYIHIFKVRLHSFGLSGLSPVDCLNLALLPKFLDDSASRVANAEHISRRMNLLQTHDTNFLENCQVLIGVDEAGRGALAGPVYAGACVLGGTFLPRTL